MILPVHIAAGLIAIISGGIAMVVTGCLAVQPMDAARRRWEVASLMFALTIVATYIVFGLAAANSPTGHFSHFPPMFYVIFGSIALLGAIGDVRLLRGSGLRGGPRLVRHLWRMRESTSGGVGNEG